MKFLVPNYSCLQNPWLGGYRPQIPVLSFPQLNLLNPSTRTKFLGTPLVTEENSCICLLLNHTLPVCSLVNKMKFCFHFCCCRNDFLHSCVQNAVVLFCKTLNHPTIWHAVTVDTVRASVVRYKMHSKHMLCLMKVCIKYRTLACSSKFRIHQAGCCWLGSVQTAQLMEYPVRDFSVVLFLIQMTSVTASRILRNHHSWPSFHPSEFCLISVVESMYS